MTPRFPRIPRPAAALAATAALALLLLADPAHAWNGQLGRWGAGVAPLLGSAALDFAALAALCSLVLALGGARLRRRLPLALALALVAGQAVCVVRAWPHAFGTLPWGVDHGAFLFRLREFREAFPALGTYNPWWNAGTEHYVGVTSGAHGFALLNLPLFLALDPAVWYGPALALWLFVGFPWLGALSLRACGARPHAALAGGLMMLAFSRAEFLFFWQSGNLGGMVTAGLTLPLTVLGYRAAALRRGGWRGALMLVPFAFLTCLWPPGAVTCAGFALGTLANAGRLTRRSFLRLLAAAALALALLSPWIWTELFPARGIADYVATGTGREPFRRMAAAGLRQLGRRLLEWHPAILAFGLGGVLLPLASPRMRRWLLPALLLLMAAAAAVGWKRNSQFDRIAIQAAGVAALPAALLCGRLLARAPRGGAARRAALVAAQGCALASLLLGARVAAAHAGNRAGFKLWPAEPVVFAFADWARANVPPGGRLAFSGETDCKLDWGKGTYLPILSGREMMSDDYYGYPKGLTERNYPPRHYRRSTEAFLFFSRAFGITHWAVTDPRTRRFCEEESDHFALVARFQMQSTDVRVYAITDPDAAAPTRLLLGEGAVEAREDRIVVRPADPNADRLVLRYRWRDALRCRTPGAEIAPHAVDDRLRFIEVRPHGAAEVVIGHRPSWKPLAPNFDGRYHH